MNPTDAARQRHAAIHNVSGRVIDCCEEDETDCPCICHDTPPDLAERRSAPHASAWAHAHPAIKEN